MAADNHVPDWWVVKQLRAMVLTDLRELIPKDYLEGDVEKFRLQFEFENSAHYSRELRWGYWAADLGRKLFFESNSMMTPRQMSASEMLMHLGMLAGAEAAQGATAQLSKTAAAKGFPDSGAERVAEKLRLEHVPTLRNNVTEGLKQYFLHLTPFEAKPFLSLLGPDYTPKQGTLSMTQNIHFHNTVGSVQTGAKSVANFTQNISAENRSSLLIALEQVKEAINLAPSIAEIEKRHLLEKTENCSTQITREESDSSVVLATFNALGTAIQSLASAQPAYEALKRVALPLGINLP